MREPFLGYSQRVEPAGDTGRQSAIPGFDWANNVLVYETRVRVLPRSSGEWGKWSPWTQGPKRCISDDWIAEARTTWGAALELEWVLDEADHPPDTVEYVFVRTPAMLFEERVRSSYPGLYDNVERLRDAIDNLGALGGELDVLDALTMILCHDRGERDRLAGEGVCRHGVFVGGCGADLMCGACEDGLA